MLVQDLINLINLEADELLDTDEDNIPYINAAIDYLSFTLAGLKDPELMTVADIAPGLPVPSNFISLVPANGYPLYTVGSVFNSTTGNVVKGVKYTISKPHVSLVTDTIPFRDMYGSVLMFIASYMIKKKSYIPVEYTSQDSTFAQAVLAAISAAKAVK
ncbi:hypothetical protein SPSIL_015200 [Sporomusa silvacetica DSM 10669]|uniref:Uncharacterized protein n=1 Tax=Sporomusa silvacetica DSM 10669 TaxID=1123289 RepID=A0ABZ3IIA1_9FIRM|nr:hypothetical protein [Sporomusa silvacetica]OZC21582.1 hypothetical protein SPSIL_09930 [Sporomusa silvacetica DSM 10669]